MLYYRNLSTSLEEKLPENSLMMQRQHSSKSNRKNWNSSRNLCSFVLGEAKTGEDAHGNQNQNLGEKSPPMKKSRTSSHHEITQKVADHGRKYRQKPASRGAMRKHWQGRMVATKCRSIQHHGSARCSRSIDLGKRYLLKGMGTKSKSMKMHVGRHSRPMGHLSEQCAVGGWECQPRNFVLMKQQNWRSDKFRKKRLLKNWNKTKKWKEWAKRMGKRKNPTTWARVALTTGADSAKFYGWLPKAQLR